MMKRAKSIALLIMALLSGQVAISQKYYFDNYSVKEGLSQSKVHDVAQDLKGFIWLATASGASRFDGNSFENFTSDDGLSENGVRTMCVDSKGQIWFGHTGGGVSLYDGKDFHRVVLDTVRHENDITSIIEDNQHRIWIGTQGAGAFTIPLEGFDPVRHQRFTQYTGKTKLSDRIFGITQTRDGRLFFIIDGMIKLYEEKDKSFTVYRHPGLSYYFQITCMMEDRDSNLWFGTYNGGLYRQNKQTGNVTVFDARAGIANNFISCISQDRTGAIWAGTWGGGITRIDPNFITFNQENGLGGDKIWKILEDREGNILIGTNDNGLSIFKGEQFVSFQPEHGLSSEQVSSIVADFQNNILIGTNKGLCKCNLTAGKITPLQLSDNSLGKEIIALKRTTSGMIWIATKEDGIYAYNPATGKIDYNLGFNSMVLRYGKVTTCMEIDSDNHIWVGTIDGLFYLEPEKNAYDRLMGNEITSLYFDRNKVMWVSLKGKGIMSIANTTFTRVDTLGNITALCMTQDLQGNIWLGTEGQGIVVYSPDGAIIRYKVVNGLLADLVTALVTDKAGNIWVGTNKGLNKFSVTDGTFYSYTQRSGFTGIEVKNHALFCDGNSNIWCGTVNGLFKFDPSKEKVNTLEPLTSITQMKVNLKNRAMVPGLKLNYTDKNIYFEYHSICLTDGEKVRYRVMLQGADNDWQPPTDQTHKNYSPLPPGHYTFKVIACNDRGVWNAQPIEYSFIVKPPFYRTWWFILSLLFIAGVIISAYIRVRERNLKMEKILLEKKVKERTAEVVRKNEELAKKNKDILDSINYARRIQQAILPTMSFLKCHLPEMFVFFRPKDIVSGDFYLFERVQRKSMFAVVDCTGHGVPGAFMSFLGHDGVQRTISEFKLSEPGLVLDKLNDLVQETLQSSDNPDVKDGMDIALCVLDAEKRILTFAGANNPLYIIRKADSPLLMRNGEAMEPALVHKGYNLFETKANKQPIGAHINRVPFTTHTFDMMEDDTLYIFSDGFADQFGGPQGRKFLYSNLKIMLMEHQHLTMTKQHEAYESILNKWVETHDQIDDICLMGVKII